MPAFEKQTVNLAPRAAAVLGIMLLSFFTFGLRLWYLQVIQGDYFRDKSENNRLREVFIPPPRGLLVDRNGVVLARNRPSFQIEFVPEDSPNPKSTLARLAQIVERPVELLQQQLHVQGKRRPFEARLLMRDISRDIVARVVAHRYELPGVMVNVIPARQYVYGELAAHVLGYIGEIQARQLENPANADYRMGDIIGQFGIEARWEKYLQGQRGVQEVIVNATGTKIGEASFKPERPGDSIALTIDVDVQRAADAALAGRKGAVVALDPNTGEVLALTSGPTFDPNIFVGELTNAEWSELLNGKKLNNRVTQGLYPPGSTFKVFTEIAGFAEGVITPHDRVTCNGVFLVGGHPFKCHKHTGHGSVDHRLALTESCDVYFYTVGTRLGVDRIHEYMTKFGLGEPTGINLGSESKGLIPSTAWKREVFANRSEEEQRWYPGETPSVAIGQGAVTVTPIQLARGIAAVVNGGKVLRPQLVRRIESVDGKFVDSDFAPEVVRTLEISPSILNMVREDMVSVVNDPSGTARRARLADELGVTVGGKTGTAQVAGLQFHTKGGDFEHHAWFVGYAPVEDPQIVVAALVENGGSGGSVAGPVVKQVMEAFFYKKQGKTPSASATPISSASPQEGQNAAIAD